MYHAPVLGIHSGALFPLKDGRCLYANTKHDICPDPFTSKKVKKKIIFYSCLIPQITKKECLLLFWKKRLYKEWFWIQQKKRNLANLSISIQSLGRFALQFPNRSLNGVFTLFFHYCPCLTDVNSANELSILSVTQGNFKIELLEYVGIHLCLHIFFKERLVPVPRKEKKKEGKREGWFPVEFWSVPIKLI